ncbi:MAG: alpha/beta hydrolase [Anaerolineales bacterium]|nr:alpha/beta hydrolase [Anaerolineales bacterium]
MSVKQKKRSRFSCCGGCSTIFIGVIVLVLVTGPLLQIFLAPRMHARILEFYPAPAQMFDVAGSQMHIYCEGQGSQTVIIINDPRDQSLAWRDVQAKLAGDARVCIYDRLGRGWSGPASRARSAKNIADELDELVKAAGIAPGFVLVGDRYATVYARMFAWRYPDQVGALLLVDEMNESPNENSFLVALAEFFGYRVLMPEIIPTITIPQAIGDQFDRRYILSPYAAGGVICPPWMDSSVCGPWTAFENDGYDMQTWNIEMANNSAAWRALESPQVQYGDLQIVILTGVEPGKGNVYADILGRTTNGRTQIVPGNIKGALFEESPQSIEDAVKALLH